MSQDKEHISLRTESGFAAMRETLETLLRHFTKEELLTAIEELTLALPPLGINVNENLGLDEKVG